MTRSYSLNSWLDKETRKRIYQKSDWKAIGIFLGQIFLYLICLVGAIADYSIIFNLIFSIYLGFTIGQIFITGHDACHQALTKSSFLNQIIGRVAFLFSLHSYSLWTVTHNNYHHNYTNIKGLDPVWCPMTKEEFESQNLVRRYLEKLYRSSIGGGFYYLLEMWLQKFIVPINTQVRSEWKKYLPDSILVLSFAILQTFVIVYLGSFLAPNKSPIEVLVLGWLIPFVLWNWFMGIVIYCHHTHPDIPWFQKHEKIPFNQIQTHVTSHVIFPKLVSRLLNSIMEHTAHHLQPTIPMYNLKLAQDKLEEVHRQNIVVYNWSLAEYWKITKICKLYDFEQRCWTDFNGNPTSKPVCTDFES